MPPVPYKVRITDHPGSSLDEIWNEPDWGEGHQHRIGFCNKQDRLPGLTHDGDEPTLREQFATNGDTQDHDSEQATEKNNASRNDKLLNFRDVLSNKLDSNSQDASEHPPGWRMVINTTEDWVKNKQNWPANLQNRKAEKDAKQQQKDQQQSEDHNNKNQETDDDDPGEDRQNQKQENDDIEHNPNEEHDWKRAEGENTKHHNAYDTSDKHELQETEYQKLREIYSPQEVALLQSLRHEKDYVSNLRQNDGNHIVSLGKRTKVVTSIDEADQFTPDNWIPRSERLVRLTGKHPLNAEPDLSELFDEGLITPSGLHYIRNHGAVPRVDERTHTLDIENGMLRLSMDELKSRFDTINIPVILACDGNRRKELNMLKRSKGFNWSSSAASCSYWRGPLLRDVLLAAGVPEKMFSGKSHESERHWVNFEGADHPSEGKYATCIPFQYAMDPTNDVILAYEMNNEPLPPDHGYPLRVIIPGWVGGRSVKWLHRIWLSDQENSSHYHIWDNRVLPSFITEKDGPFAETMFRHPDTACNEQNLQSVIVYPAQGEKIPLSTVKKGKPYRIQGYAYDGAGHAVQRVEVSLDEGETWLYCIRRWPDAPIRHGNRFWSWLHWHVDVEMAHLVNSKSIVVRAWNVFKNTQPEKPSWNIMGMMNNCWYRVRSDVVTNEQSPEASILFRHPVASGTSQDGWMKPSTENRIANIKQQAGAPTKQFTREEVEKHCTQSDCWIVVDGKVYEATSVLSWHPGGTAAILGHAGKVHAETSTEFSSVHDDFAYQKLQECALGELTDKAKTFVKKQAEAAAKEQAQAKAQEDKSIALQKHQWISVKLTQRRELSKDTRSYTFELPKDSPKLGLGACQHVQVGFHFKDRMLIRSYTPTKPLLPAINGVDRHSASEPDGTSHQTQDADYRDGNGTFELTVKTYFPTNDQPGGAMSNILDVLPHGSSTDIRGPTGDIVYLGGGNFNVEGRELYFPKINLVLGGSGITPGYSLIARAMMGGHAEEAVQIRVIDANKTEGDILLKDELDEFVKGSNGRLDVVHILSHPSNTWKGKKGHVDEDLIKGVFFPPDSSQPLNGNNSDRKGDNEGSRNNTEDDKSNMSKTATFVCGPPGMIQKAALPALKDWGFVEEQTLFGF